MRGDAALRAARVAVLLGGALSLGALALYGTRAATSVLVGAALAVGNLLALRGIVRAVLRAPEDSAREDAEASPSAPEGAEPRSGGGGAGWAILAIFKMLLFFGGLGVLLVSGIVDPMPLLVGYGVLPLGIALSAAWPGPEEES